MAKAGSQSVSWGQRNMGTSIRRLLSANLPKWLVAGPSLVQPQQPGLRALARALGELPIGRCEVFVLRRFDGLSAAELSRREGVSSCRQEKCIATVLLHCLRRLQGRAGSIADEQAAYWFSRRLTGELTLEQELLFQAWLAAAPAHAHGFYDLQRIWSDCEQLPRPNLPSQEKHALSLAMVWELLLCTLIVGGLLIGSSGW